MEFGKLSDISHIDWTIPDDDPSSIAFLAGFASKAMPQIYIGAPAWNHKEWVGKIYPPEAKNGEYLQYYARYFNCIELNTTHYRIPTSEQVQKWREQVGSNFLFCPKLFQGISHQRHGLKNREVLNEWFQFLAQLKENLGPSFLQLPPHFAYSDKRDLFEFLQNWPREFELAIEFRHPSWFQGPKILEALTDYLQKQKIGLVITDVAGRRDVLHTSISSDYTMLRFIGNDLHVSDYARAQKWVDRIKSWGDQGLQRCFFFVHEPDDLLTIEMTDHLLELLVSSHLYASKPARTSPAQKQLDMLI